MTFSPGDIEQPPGTIMRRRGAAEPGKHPIVGVWEYEYFTGAQATWHFQDTGDAYLNIPYELTLGRFRTLAENRLELTWDGQDQLTLHYLLKDERLTLLLDNRERVLQRMPITPVD